VLITFWALFSYMNKAVLDANEGFSQKASNNSEEELLHANTMYWYARANGNTNHEFDQAEKLAKNALVSLMDKKDSLSNVMRYKAMQIIKNAQVNKNQSAITVNNKYPYFLDFSSQNTLQEEDQELDQMDRVATMRVLNNLMESPEFSSSKMLKDIPYFSIIVHHSNDPELTEAAVQLLNLSTKHYTISNHEIAQITGEEHIDVSKLTRDTSAMEKICSYFNTGQIAVINIVKQDQFDGIYYYGASLKLYAPISDKNDQIRYAESFVKTRGYNAMLGIKIPLFLSYLLWLILGTELLYLLGWFSFKRFGYKRLLLTGTISLIINIVCIEALAYFWNPESGEFAGTDKAMIWIADVALTYTLFPVLIGHLAVGKLDIFVKSFDSALDDRNGLLSVVFPGLSVYAVSISYYNLLKFGMGSEMLIVPYACLYALVMSLLLSNSWKRIKDLPARASLPISLLTYGVSGISILGAFMYPYLTFGVTDIKEVQNLFIIWTGIPGLIVLLSESRFIKGMITDFSNQIEKEINFHFQKLSSDILEFEIESSIEEKLIEKDISIVYGATRMGKTTLVSRLIQRLYQKDKFKEIVYIDLGIKQPTGYKYKLNYYPFVLGFGHLLPENVFNDQAEEARKSGNIIGKLISAITSAGDFLVDDSESKPANIIKLRELLIDKLKEKKTLLIFENVHLCQDESKELLLFLIQGIQELEAEQSLHSEAVELSKQRPMILVTSTHGYHIKGQFEVILESLINIRYGELNFILNEKKLSEEQDFPPFYCLTHKSDFLAKYISHFKTGIFDQKFLLEKFRNSEKDKSPGIVAEMFKKLKGMNVVTYDENEPLVILKREFEVPEITEELETFEQIIKGLTEDLFEVIRCCAYCALDHGEFDLNAVCFILDKDRLDILTQLKRGEEFNIIYDAKNRNNWYRFNDVRFLSVLKRKDGKELDAISQLGKEFYFRWVKYYMEHFSEMELDFNSSREILATVAERAYLIKDIDAKFAFETLKKLGIFFLTPSISLLDYAYLAYSNALKICSSIENVTDQKAQEIANLKINGILRTLDQKNELDSAEATQILRESADLVQQNPSLSEEIYFYNKLAYAKSAAYNPENALEHIADIDNHLNSTPSNSSLQIKLRFLKLLLTPKNNATDEDLEKMRLQFKTLLSEIEIDPNLLSENEDIYHQILNNYGGSILADNLIGRSTNISEKEAYFIEAVRVLIKRVQFELDKCIQLVNKQNLDETSDYDIAGLRLNLPNNVNEALTTIQTISHRLSEEKFRYIVDRKGLTYTLNYLTRALYNLITDHNKLTYDNGINLEQVLKEISELAYIYNEDVNDTQGYIMAASFRGLIHQIFGRSKAAFEDFERSFVHSFGKNQGQTNMALNNMKNLLKEIPKDLPELQEKFNLYNQQNTARHLLRHFTEISDKKLLIKRNVVMDEKDLRIQIQMRGSKFDHRVFKSPFEVIDFIENALQKKKEFIQFKEGKAYLEFEHEVNVGTDNVVPIEEISKNHVIRKDKREGADVLVVDNYPVPSTKFFSVVLSEDLISVFTAHPGRLAPEFPKNTLKEPKLSESIKYWNSHVFVN
jgi:hypothetical protein